MVYWVISVRCRLYLILVYVLIRIWPVSGLWVAERQIGFLFVPPFQFSDRIGLKMDKVLCSLKFICKATTSNVFPILPTHVVALLAQPCKFVFVSKLLDASIISFHLRSTTTIISGERAKSARALPGRRKTIDVGSQDTSTSTSPTRGEVEGVMCKSNRPKQISVRGWIPFLIFLTSNCEIYEQT